MNLTAAGLVGALQGKVPQRGLARLGRELSALPAASVRTLAAEAGLRITGDGNIVGHNNTSIVVKGKGAATLAHVLRETLERGRALHQLRAPVADFVGRDQEIAELASELRGGGCAGISGLGGMGKTELALQVAADLCNDYPDAQLFVELRGTDPTPRPPADALAGCIRAFIGSEARLPETLEELGALYRSQLSGKRALIVLDNAADNAQVHHLLASEGCSLLITSRRALALPGMKQRPQLEQLAPSEARKLLTSIVLRLPPAIADKIAGLCGYLPLALRASGSLLHVTADLDPADYAAQLADERTRLERIGTETVEAGVEASFNLSYAHLSSEAQRVFVQLSVFPASFNARGEEVVCEDPGHAHLSDLVRRSLVLYDSQTGRYRLHDLVRLFAALRLKSDVARRRHRDWYLKFAEERSFVLREGGDQPRALGEMELEHDNLRGALDWCTAKSDWGPALGLCANLWRFWEIYRLSEGRKDLRRLIETVEKLGPRFDTSETPETVAALGRVYSGAGPLAYRQGDGREAMVFSKRAFEIEEKRGDPKRVANCLNDLGLAAQATGNLQGALQYYRDYLAVARKMRCEARNRHRIVQYWEHGNEIGPLRRRAVVAGGKSKGLRGITSR